MRILAIRGCNLASLAGEFEIDLARAPFCDAGVFAIVGNTGAGKSTLLDALCVALFDRTPRLTNHSRVVVGRGDDDPAALGAQDVRTLLRRGAAAGWAEVDFEAGDARRYRARWSVRRARGQTDGTLQDQQISLSTIDGNERFGGTKTETLKAIVARLGLTFDQFRRSALLAQGEFAAFLRADGKDRSELLERMTGTEIYSRLSVAAHLRATLAEQRTRDARVKADIIPVLADDERARTRADLGTADAAKLAARTRLAAAESAARWRDEDRRVRVALADAEHDQAMAVAAAGASDSDRAELALRRRADQLRPIWDEAARIDRALAIAQGEAGAADAAVRDARVTYGAIIARRAALTTMHEPIRAARIAAGIVEYIGSTRAAGATDIAAARATDIAAHVAGSADTSADALAAVAKDDAAWLVARAALAPEIAGWAELDTRFAQYGVLVDAVASIERTVRDHTVTRTKSCKARDVVAADHAAAANKLAEAQRKATGYQQRRGLTLDAARRQEDEARTRLTEVERLVAIAVGARDAIFARDQIDVQVKEIEEHAAADGAARARIDGELAVARSLRGERARVVEELRRAAGYEHARAELRDGESCPLCGATEHPWKERGAFDGVIRQEEVRLAEATSAIDVATGALANIVARAHQRDKDRLRLTRARETAVASAASNVDRWREQLAALGELLLEHDPATGEAARIATELEAAARSKLEHARSVFSHTQAATKAAQEAHAEMQLAQANVDQLHALVGDHDRRVAELDATLSRLAGERTTRTERCSELAAELAAAVVRWRDATQPDIAAPASVRRDATPDRPGLAQPDMPGVAGTTGMGGIHGTGGMPGTGGTSGMPGTMPGMAAPGGMASPGGMLGMAAVGGMAGMGGMHGTDGMPRDATSSRKRRREDIEIPADDLVAARVAMSELATAWRVRAERVAIADATIAAALTTIERGERDASRATTEHATRHQAATERRDALVVELRESAARLDAARAAAGFDPDELRRLLAADPSRADELADKLAALDRAVLRARAVVVERRARVEAHAATRPASGDDDADRIDELASMVVAADHDAARLVAALAADTDARARREAALAMLADVEAAAEVDRVLGDVIGSHDGKLFRSFAQSLTLDSLLGVANSHLEELAPRYQLERVPRHDLELQVIDRDLGQEVRSVQSLSGGESFLVSLALALGLSSMSAHDVRVRTLLIDEGFGTLDPATLESALSVLDTLQSTGRQVGVISHVPALVERVGAHVRVIQRGGGRSEVIVA